MWVSVLLRRKCRPFLLEIYIELVFHFQQGVTRIKFLPHRNNILEKTWSNLLQNFLLYDLLRSIQILLPLEEEMDDNRNSDLLKPTTIRLLKLKRDEPRNEYREISAIKNKNLTPIPLSFFKTNRDIDVALNGFETSGNCTPRKYRNLLLRNVERLQKISWDRWKNPRNSHANQRDTAFNFATRIDFPFAEKISRLYVGQSWFTAAEVSPMVDCSTDRSNSVGWCRGGLRVVLTLCRRISLFIRCSQTQMHPGS